MNHASGTVTPLDPELIQVGDAIGQRAQRRGLVQGSVRPVPVAEVLVLAQHDHQMPLSPGRRPSFTMTPTATGPGRARWMRWAGAVSGAGPGTG